MTDTPGWDPDQPFQRATARDGRGESAAANRALRDFLVLGPARTLPGLLRLYANDPGAPTRSAATLKTWCGAFHWERRASRFDRLQADARQHLTADESRQVLGAGFALPHVRVQKLTGLLEQVDGFLQLARRLAQDGEGAADGNSDLESLVAILRSVAPLFGQARGLLADLARETGRLEARPADAPLDLSRLSREEIDTLDKIMSKTVPEQLLLL